MFGIDDLTLLSDVWLAPAVLLAQTGFAKTMLGYVAVGVLIVLGLAVVCRPTHRPPADAKKK